MRKPLIVGNWKMNKTMIEAGILSQKIVLESHGSTKIDIVLCPPFIALSVVHNNLKDSLVKLGAQNMHWERSGAYTGETAPEMLKEVGCDYVILGHSERRQYFKEDNEMINKKIKAAVTFDIIPILCVGETLEQRESGKTKEIIREHLLGGLKDMTTTQALKIVIAYEPVWAIGTGKTATPNQAQEIHGFIRSLLINLYSENVAQQIKIIYGGSVKAETMNELMSESDIDGVLVGGSSLEADSFMKILNYNETRV